MCYKARAIALVVIVLLAGCAAPTPPDTGITGQVLIGPMCPVERVGNPCPDKPYQATIAVLHQNGQEFTRFTTDANGLFRVSLAPGTYTLRPQPGQGIAHAPDQTVTVVEGQYTSVTITYDSGIR